MAKIALRDCPIHIEYVPSEIERGVELGINELGLRLADGRLVDGEIELSDDEIAAFEINQNRLYEDYLLFGSGYTKGLDEKFGKNYRGVDVYYERVVDTEDGVSVETMLQRMLQDHHDFSHYITFAHGPVGSDALTVFSHKIDIGTAIRNHHIEAQILQNMDRFIFDRFKQHHRRIDIGYMCAAPLLDIYHTAIEFLKQ